jgi:hypothetical protein
LDRPDVEPRTFWDGTLGPTAGNSLPLSPDRCLVRILLHPLGTPGTSKAER